ncbi:unnamed protein product [Ilex paraguariensis]|uniref:Uncharacterized protein n=1 Tax=Ilex paraguariensis TaxID=185542 RepID=A0ABC8R244_9AQUA
MRHSRDSVDDWGVASFYTSHDIFNRAAVSYSMDVAQPPSVGRASSTASLPTDLLEYGGANSIDHGSPGFSPGLGGLFSIIFPSLSLSMVYGVRRRRVFLSPSSKRNVLVKDENTL